MNYPIFMDHKKRRFFLDLDNSLKCSQCSNRVNSIVYFICVWNRKRPSSIHLLCFSCFKKTKLKEGFINIGKDIILGDAFEIFFSLVKNKNVPGLVPVILEPPRFVPSSIIPDVFSAAEIPTPRVIDRTIYAGRESFEGMSIGDPDIFLKLEEKDAKKVIYVDDFLNRLNNLPTAFIGAEDKKVLEEKK